MCHGSAKPVRIVYQTASLIFFALVQISCTDINLKAQLEDPGLTGTETFTDRLMIFVSDSVTVGNMEALFASGCSGTGIQRADCYCQAKAKAYNRRMSAGSRFVAWLSETGVPDNTMLCRILGQTGNGCAPTGTFTWYGTDFQPIVSGMANLFNATPAFSSAIRLTETGNPAPIGSDDVWTGTAQDGTSNAQNCNNWSSVLNSTLGLAGQSDQLNSSWTNKATGACDLPRRIYCFAVP